MVSSNHFLFSEQTDRLDQLLVASANPIYVFDCVGCFLYASPAGLAALGLKAGDILGRTWQELNFPSDMMERHYAQQELVFETGSLIRGETRFPTIRGIRDYEYTISPVMGEEDNIDIIVCTLFDITEHRQMELSLQASETKLNQILNGTSASIASMKVFADGTWQYDYYSTGCEVTFGYTSTEMMMGIWQSRVLPEDRESVLQLSREAIFAERPICLEYRFQHKDGTLRWISSILSSQWDENNNCWQVIAIDIDITERKQSELAWRESEARFAAVFQSSPDAMLITRISDGLILYANTQFTQLSGYSLEESIGQTTLGLQLWTNPTDREIMVAYLQTQSFLQNYEMSYQSKAGETHIGLFSCQVIELSGQNCILSVVRDISDRKQTETALRESEERLRIALEAAHMGSWDWNIITNQIIWSEGLEQLMGIQPGTFDGRFETFTAMLHPADRQRVLEAITCSIEQDNEYDIEFRFIKPDGRVRWAASKGNVLRNLSGQAIRMVGVDMDVTDRKQAEVLLQERDNLLCLFYQYAPAGIAMLDREMRYLMASQRWIDDYHLEPLESLIGRSHYEVFPEIPEHWKEVHQRCLAGTIETCDDELFVRADGTQQWLRLETRPWYTATDEIGGIIIFAEEISQQKKVEASILQLNQELQQKVTELQTLLDVIPIGIGIAEDRECRRIRVNPAFARFLNIPPTDNASLSAPEADRPKNFKVYQNGRELSPEELPMQRAAHGVEVRDLEVDVVWKDGTVVKLLEYAAPLFDQQGQPRGCVGAFLDITDRKQAELALQELNQSLEGIVAERTAALRASETQIRQQANREALLREITQRIRQSLDLPTIFDTACQEILRWSQADRVCIFQFDRDSRFNDGKFVAEAVLPGFPSVLATPVHLHCFGDQFVTLYQQGQVHVIQDIYDSTLQNTHRDILAQFQIRSNLVVPLFQTRALWGLLCIHQCLAPRQWQPFEIQVAQEITNQLEIAVQQASLFDQLQQQLIERQEAQQLLTERNQQLAISNQELAHATRLKDEFLANMSHELRTPLNAILGMTEGLQDRVFGVVNDQQLKALGTVTQAGLHLLSLINDILDLAKVESGQIELNCAPTAVMTLCQSSLDFIRQQAFKKQIRFELKSSSNLPELFVDELRIRQALVNLLNNAVKFTPEGGQILLEVSWPISLQEDETGREWLRFAVIDTGIGIVPENIPRLFQPFIQIDSALARQYEGTGLGLALVKRLVELHGGHVGVTSEVGVGSCFTIDLPGTITQPSTPVQSQVDSQPELSQTNQSASPLILLVEDNEDNVTTIAAYLEVKGNRMLVARSGQEAIALVQAECPDLILMDIQMPGMDGLEAIRQIRCLPNLGNIPIIALTALAMEGDRERCLAAGANDYLSKPVQLKQLVATIQQLLGSNLTE